jgi:hypothetical protein
VSHPIVEQILAGAAAPHIRQAGARGALPIPREDILELWVCLRNDGDQGIKMTVRENLAAVKVEEWLDILPSYPFRPEFFDFAVRVLGKDPRIALAIMRNKALPNMAVQELAKTAPTQLIDLILDGQARLISSPEIVVSLLNNSHLNATQGRRIFDLAEQFLRSDEEVKKLVEEKLGLTLSTAEVQEIIKEASVEIPVPPTVKTEVKKESPEQPAEASAGGGAEAPSQVEAGLELPPEALKETLEQEEVQSLFKKILTMSVPHKIELALKGNKEARSLLIRDSNKMIQTAVVTSPKITEQEIEAIAKLRNVPEEILRKISTMGEFMKKYSVMKALATNPKTPLAVAIPLVAKFTDLDMKFLLKDKGVSETLRREAKKIWEFKNSKKVVSFKKH